MTCERIDGASKKKVRCGTQEEKRHLVFVKYLSRANECKHLHDSDLTAFALWRDFLVVGEVLAKLTFYREKKRPEESKGQARCEYLLFKELALGRDVPKRLGAGGTRRPKALISESESPEEEPCGQMGKKKESWEQKWEKAKQPAKREGPLQVKSVTGPVTSLLVQRELLFVGAFQQVRVVDLNKRRLLKGRFNKTFFNLRTVRVLAETRLFQRDLLLVLNDSRAPVMLVDLNLFPRRPLTKA